MAKRNNIQTDLIGTWVQITIGIDPKDDDAMTNAYALAESYRKADRPCPDCWRYFGDKGKVRGAYVDPDGCPSALVEMGGGRIIDVAMIHLVVTTEP